MPKTGHTVRRFEPPRRESFDEQLWPIYVALIALGAVLAGFCISVLDFNERRIHRNAITWLVLLPVLIGLAVWGLHRVGNRIARRVVLLSLVLSLVLNAGLMILMAWTNIFSPLPMEQQQQTAEIKPETVEPIPDDVLQPVEPPELPQRDFEKPVQTGALDAPRGELVQQDTRPAEAALSPAEPAQAPTPVASDHLRPLRREAESAPHYGQEPSRLARQPQRPESPPAPALAAVAEQPPLQAPPAPVEAEVASVDRQAAETTLPQTNLDAQTLAPRIAPTPQLARRESSEQPQLQASATPALRRPIDQPRSVPSTPAATLGQAGISRQTDPDALRPVSVPAQRQLASASPSTTDPAPLAPDAATQIARIPVTRRQRSQPWQQLAQTPQPELAQREPIRSPPTLDGAAADAQPTAPASPQPGLASSQIAMAPQRTQSAALDEPVAPADQLQPGGSAQPSRAPGPRARVSDVPTIRSEAQSAQLPAQTRSWDDLATSPAAIPNPASAEVPESTGNPTAVPARLALTKSDNGVAGIGRAANLSPTPPAPPSPIDVASASVPRATPVQQLPRGPAITPSAPARVPLSVARDSQPRASARALPVTAATERGDRQPVPLAANASASPIKAAASAPPASFTASPGDAQVDLGPTRIASSAGRGRAGGGGQPIVNTLAQGRSAPRSATGGEPALSIVAENIAPSVTAPQGEGGGQPLSLAADLQSLPSTRAAEPDELSTPAGPTAVAEIGPAAVASGGQLSGAHTPGRAERIDATEGMPEPGGGTLSRPRPALSRPMPASRPAETLAAAGGPPSSGSPEGQPIAAEGTEPSRAAPGAPGELLARPLGAAAGAEPTHALNLGPPDHAVAARSASHSDDDGPLVAAAYNRGAPAELSRRAQVASAIQTDATAAAVASPPASPEPDPDAPRLAGGIDTGPLLRQRAGTLPTPSLASPGPGGLADEIAMDVGLPIRRAQEESQQLQPSTARFVRSQVGGPLPLNVGAELTADAFRQRSRRHGDPQGGGTGQLSPQTEEVIEQGLVFLARHQAADGSWHLDEFNQQREGYPAEPVSIRSDSAATALAALAFLGAGYHHQNYQYRKVVGSALDFLVNNQNPHGELYVAQDNESNRVAALYSHALATIALCEAYGMTQDPNLRDPAQKALDYIVDTQHPEQGGWRYTPGIGSDTSVTGWMMMALKSGELANLEVPSKAYERIARWLDLAQASRTERHLYRYNPFAPDTDEQRHGRRPTGSMTAVGLLMRLYMGWRRDDQRMIAGADYLMDNLPEMGTARNNLRDTYYWYYATQVMFHMGGTYWEAWNSQLHPLLVETQVTEGPLAGSWNPRLPVPDRWGPHGGRLYVTTMNLLSLEVFYRHLPIYEETAR